MNTENGRSPSGRAGALRAEPAAQSQAEPLVPNAKKMLLTGMGPSSDGGFEIAFRDGPESGGALHIMAAGMAEMMHLGSDKPLNCIQVDVQPAGQPLLRLTMQRAGGKSPLALKAEAKRLLEQTLEAIETGRSEPLYIMRDAIRNWLADDPASGMSAFGQDPKGLEAKPASPVGNAETPESQQP